MNFLPHRLFVMTMALCTLVASSPSVFATPLEPFAYPSSLLDAPATLTTPAGESARVGKPQIVLEHTPMSTLAKLVRSRILKEGQGDFARQLLCVQGTEHARPVLAWFISSDNETVTEVQLQWAPKIIDSRVCRHLPASQLPIRLGKIGLGQSKDEVLKHLGEASHQADDGWMYWFSQRFLRNARNLQELELNWLSVHFDEQGLVDKAFISQVTNL